MTRKTPTPPSRSKKAAPKRKPAAKPATAASKQAVATTTAKTAKKAVKKPAPKKSAPKKPVRRVAAPVAPAAPAVPEKPPYIPTENEKYMNKRQLVHFRRMLERMRAEILANNDRLVDAIKDDEQALPDENDRASKESKFTVELRERERERRLLDKVDSALQRVENKNFGHCAECGDPIGLQRLLARPVAALCIECKSLQEMMEKTGMTGTN